MRYYFCLKQPILQTAGSQWDFLLIDNMDIEVMFCCMHMTTMSHTSQIVLN